MRVLALLLLLAMAPLAAWAQGDVRQLAGAVDAHYNHLRSLETQFTESYRGAGINREESGTLWLKRPGRMRWEYQRPQPKLFVTDGKQAWFYVPGERQARQTQLKNLDDLRSPLAYLLGKTKLEKEFSGLSLAPDVAPAVPPNRVLRGIPKFMPQVSQVLFEIAPEGRIERIVVEQEDGATIEYRFSGQKENVEPADSEFHFAPPPGVEVIRAEAGQ